MGKWNYRRHHHPNSNRRNKYRDYDWSPPRETHRDPEFSVWQDNVPLWEKKFCFLAGVPWEKVLSTKKFMYCHNNILEWNDTAGEESFHNAKEFYLAKLNGGECEIHPPGPDEYNEEIDWNPNIDPELIEDLDHTFFVPDDKESRCDNIVQETKVNSFGSLKGPDRRLDNRDSPWDCDQAQSSGVLKDNSGGGNQGNDSVDAREEPTNYANPWECHDTQGSATNNNNPWERGHASTSQEWKDKGRGWSQWDGSVDVQDKPSNYGNSWVYHGSDNPWECGHAQTSQWLKKKPSVWNQCDDRMDAIEKQQSNNGNPWGYRDRSAATCAKNGNGRGAWSKACDGGNNKWNKGKGWHDFQESSWGCNQGEAGMSRSSYRNGSNYSANINHVGASKERKQFGEYGGGSRGSTERWGDMSKVCRKREGPGENLGSGHKGPRLQYIDQTSRRWNSGSSNRRVSFQPQ